MKQVLALFVCLRNFVAMNSIPLSTLAKGESGIIQKVEDSHLSLKLMEMGCMPGETVRVQAVSPFGDPIAIRVAECTLSLRKIDAQTILISPLD